MKTVALFVGIAAAAMAVSGCAEPEMLFEAAPVSNETVWYDGSQYVTQTVDSVTVSVAFLNELEGAMTFYVVVGNEGTRTLLADPGRIYYEAGWKKLRDVTDYSNVSSSGLVNVKFDTLSGIDTIFAYDPQMELRGIDRQAAISNATYTNETSMNAAAGLLHVIGGLATIGERKSTEDLHREREQGKEIRRSQAYVEMNYASQSASLAQQRAYWENLALRKTTLFPGCAIGGRVRIPVDDRARTLRLVIPVSERDFTFEFRQRPLARQ